MLEYVILVDRDDAEPGTQEKIEAHREGNLHRAFSVFVYNSQGDLLIQQRSGDKYHAGGLWTNACDGHPRPGEPTAEAARRRLREEMGFDCDLEHVSRFIYRAELDHELIEHEVDHVYVGHFNGEPEPDPDEAAAYRWVSPAVLKSEIEQAPNLYAPWFKIALRRLPSG